MSVHFHKIQLWILRSMEEVEVAENAGNINLHKILRLALQNKTK